MKNWAPCTALGSILLAATSAFATVPQGSYLQSCSNATVADNVLRARCRTMSGAMVNTSLTLPCKGSIDNVNGKLTCTGAPAAGVPPGSYLQSCGDARVQGDTLVAKCRRASQAVVDASLKLPCAGRIDNLDGKLTCVGGNAPPSPTRAALDPAYLSLLQQWHRALEAWRGNHFLEAPTVTTPAALKKLLVQWHGALEAFAGRHILEDPAKLGDSPTHAELVPLLSQWKNALEGWRGYHILIGIKLMPDGTLATYD